MITLASSPLLFQRVGVGLLVLQLCLFMFGLPPFHIGIWVQVEPILLALFLFAYLNAAWLALGLAKRWLMPMQPTPLWIALLLWIGWQILTLPTAYSAWRGWFGAPELGEGVAWHVALGLLAMLASSLLSVDRYRRCLIAAALMSIVIQCLLHGLFPRAEGAYDGVFNVERWAASRYPKDLPFLAGYAWIALHAHGRRLRKIETVMLILGFAAVLTLSANRTAILFLGLALAVNALHLLMPRLPKVRRLTYPSVYGRLTAITSCLLPLGWLWFGAHFSSLSPYLSHIPLLSAQRGQDHSLVLSEKDASLGGRIPLIQVGIDVMRHEPWRWLTGAGWGNFTDDLYRYALVDGVHTYEQGQYAPNWSALQDVSAFHSHSQPLEALLALGLAGCVLWFAIPIIAIACLPKRRFWSLAPMIAAMTGLSFFWFEPAQSVPFKALALASLGLTHTRTKRFPAVKADVSTLVLCCLCLAMGWTAWQQRLAIRYGEQVRYAIRYQPPQQVSVEWLARDARRGGDRFRQSAMLYAHMLKMTAPQQPLNENDLGWYVLFMQAAHQIAQMPSIGARVSSTEVLLDYPLLTGFGGALFMPLRSLAARDLPENLVMLAQKARLRDDVATPLLFNLPNLMPDEQMRIDYLHRLLAIMPNHRGALWVLGQLLRNDPASRQEGEAMMDQARARGVADIFPMP